MELINGLIFSKSEDKIHVLKEYKTEKGISIKKFCILTFEDKEITFFNHDSINASNITFDEYDTINDYFEKEFNKQEKQTEPEREVKDSALKITTSKMLRDAIDSIKNSNPMPQMFMFCGRTFRSVEALELFIDELEIK